MASKTYSLDGLGDVVVTKRRSNRHLRLTIATSGEVRVSIPTWAPYEAGLEFARSKQLWIEQKRPSPTLLTNNQPIGRAHRLAFTAADVERVKSRVSGNQITISYPSQLSFSDSAVQSAATAAAVKALRSQAESLLPKRLNDLSNAHQLPFKDVRIKQLQRRWGSCDQDRRIVLNLFLIQLPWDLIDYVLLHELTHTRHLNHGPDFWQRLESMSPNARILKKTISGYHPGII